MQIYKEFNIGTAKITEEEVSGINHYMIDILDGNQKFNVSEYKNMAENYIEEIYSHNNIPIFVGGTGLYLNSILYDFKTSTKIQGLILFPPAESEYLIESNILDEYVKFIFISSINLSSISFLSAFITFLMSILFFSILFLYCYKHIYFLNIVPYQIISIYCLDYLITKYKLCL